MSAEHESASTDPAEDPAVLPTLKEAASSRLPAADEIAHAGSELSGDTVRNFRLLDIPDEEEPAHEEEAAAEIEHETPAASPAAPSIFEAASALVQRPPDVDALSSGIHRAEVIRPTRAMPLDDRPPDERPLSHETVWQPYDFKLVLEQGLSIGKEFLLSETEMLVGRRDPEQDFIPDIDLFDQETPNNRYISRRQARLYFRNNKLFLEDLDSSNGTAINNKLIAPHEPRTLALNDRVLFGQSVMLRVKRV